MGIYAWGCHGSMGPEGELTGRRPWGYAGGGKDEEEEEEEEKDIARCRFDLRSKIFDVEEKKTSKKKKKKKKRDFSTFRV